jgi:hypothetical protein
MNLTKIENGFRIDGRDVDYIFKNSTYEILSDTQCHIETNLGTIFFDTDVTIEGESFNSLQDWINKLYS